MVSTPFRSILPRVDAGQLRECDCIQEHFMSQLKEKRDTEARIRKKKREEEAAKAAKARAAKEERGEVDTELAPPPEEEGQRASGA